MTSIKVAVLDLGTNTFNLLLVKITPSAYYIFRNEKIPVKIGEGGINQGIITEEAQQRALEALVHYRKIIEREKITKVYGFATSAFRNAKNGEQFKKLIREKIGLPINIISGNREAEFIYKGVKAAFDIGGENSLIMDIGGGSVEFIIGNRDAIIWKKSFDIGAQRLLDWFHNLDPIPKKEIKKLFKFFDKELFELNAQIEKYKPSCLIGSSGTFDTLSEMYQHQINIFTKGDETELPLSTDGFKNLFQQIISLNKEERLKIPGMIEMRADMIVVASCLVKYIIDKFDMKRIRVSVHALKEGMITDIQEELNDKNKLVARSN